MHYIHWTLSGLGLRETGGKRPVAATITPMSSAHASQAAAEWGQQFARRRQAGEQDEDILWDWEAKWRELLIRSSTGRGYVIAADGAIQGMLLIECSVRSCRLLPNASLTYVHALATAPWNRGCSGRAGRFHGVGTLLLNHTVWESLRCGDQGRVGLHSLSGSDAYYRKLGFCDFGLDPLVRGKRYFELEPSQADALWERTAAKYFICDARQQ